MAHDSTQDAATKSSSPRAAVPDGRLEKEIQHDTKGALELLGFHVYNLSQARASKQTPGLGDLFVVGHGRCAWAEMKRPGETQTPDQELFGERVRANGGEYHVWHDESEAIAWALEARSAA